MLNFQHTDVPSYYIYTQLPLISRPLKRKQITYFEFLRIPLSVGRDDDKSRGSIYIEQFLWQAVMVMAGVMPINLLAKQKALL